MKKKIFVYIIALLTIFVPGCGGSQNEIEKLARESFESYVSFASTPYRNEKIKVVSSDDNYATVNVSAEFQFTKGGKWIEQETNIECRKVGKDWQCDNIFIMSKSKNEIQKQNATKVAGAAVATEISKNLQELITVEVIGEPVFKGSGHDKELAFDVQITNKDSQPHFVCAWATTLVSLPENIERQTVRWWGLSWNDELKDCLVQVNGNSTTTYTVGVGGSGGREAGWPGPNKIESVSDITFKQICASISKIDKSEVVIRWKKNQSESDCKR
jgi:hypothetical protein